MKILLVRHGQTNINNERRIQGRTDNPLNEQGYSQAHIIGKFLKNNNFSFAVAYSSPLQRAYKTGEIVLSYLDGPNELIISDDFIERDFGSFEGELAKPIIEKISKKDYTAPGFEDDQTLIKRVLRGIDKVYQKEGNKTVILFCHSHVIKSLLITADSTLFNFGTFLENGSSHLFSYDGETVKLLQFNLVSP